MTHDTLYDTAIIGGGPAGLTAGIYATRYGLKTALLERISCGGQMNMTATVENYPGFPGAIPGYELGMKMTEQAGQCGVEFLYEEVVGVDFAEPQVKVLKTSNGEVRARTVIIAAGAHAGHLGIPGEGKYMGRGVSTCGTCDAPLYKNKVVAAVGGGNTALEEACILAKHAKKVWLIHRRDEFRGQKILQDHVRTVPNIELLLSTVPLEVLGETGVKAVRIKDLKNETTNDLPVDGLFVFVGMKPNTDLFKGKLSLSESGFILTGRDMETSAEGVWACGDIVEKDLRQITLAVGEATRATHSAYKWLEEKRM